MNLKEFLLELLIRFWPIILFVFFFVLGMVYMGAFKGIFK